MKKLEIENRLKDNKLPEGWAKVKLDSLLIESKERNITNKKLLVFSISNVKGFVLQDEYFSHNIHSEKTTNYKIFRENYFGYNPARINVGSIALSEKQREGLLSPMYVIFKTKSTLNPKYLKYFIQTSHFKNNVINNVAGSVRESLNYSSLEMFDFIYPISISEQNRIAEILETIDKAIDKTDAIIEKYKRIKQGLMQELLTRGIDENGQIRSEETHKFKDSPLGRIPKEWDVVEVGEIGKIVTGSTPSTERAEYYGIDYPFISPEDINYEKYIIKTVKMLSRLGFKISRKIPSKSICVVCIGSTIGKLALTIEETTTNQQINTIVPNRKMYDPDGLYYFTLFYVQKPLRIEAGLQAVPIVNKRKFAKIKILIPPLPEQRCIAEVLSQIDETIEKEQKCKEKLERIKQGLMEDLLTCKVRVLNVN